MFFCELSFVVMKWYASFHCACGVQCGMYHCFLLMGCLLQAVEFQCPLCEFSAGDSFSLTFHVQSRHSETSRRCKKTPQSSPTGTPQDRSRSVSPAARPVGAGQEKKKKKTIQSGSAKEGDDSRKGSRSQLLSPQTPPEQTGKTAKGRSLGRAVSATKSKNVPEAPLETPSTGRKKLKRKRSPSPDTDEGSAAGSKKVVTGKVEAEKNVKGVAEAKQKSSASKV